ncbi:hypothetical protein DIPPA_00953 [Diplonema papillatum]|nr:hypothetical protein DIPPA_00953 [Diplonema papillatum]
MGHDDAMRWKVFGGFAVLGCVLLFAVGYNLGSLNEDLRTTKVQQHIDSVHELTLRRLGSCKSRLRRLQEDTETDTTAIESIEKDSKLLDGEIHNLASSASDLELGLKECQTLRQRNEEDKEELEDMIHKYKSQNAQMKEQLVKTNSTKEQDRKQMRSRIRVLRIENEKLRVRRQRRSSIAALRKSQIELAQREKELKEAALAVEKNEKQMEEAERESENVPDYVRRVLDSDTIDLNARKKRSPSRADESRQDDTGTGGMDNNDDDEAQVKRPRRTRRQVAENTGDEGDDGEAQVERPRRMRKQVAENNRDEGDDGEAQVERPRRMRRQVAENNGDKGDDDEVQVERPRRMRRQAEDGTQLEQPRRKEVEAEDAEERVQAPRRRMQKRASEDADERTTARRAEYRRRPMRGDDDAMRARDD